MTINEIKKAIREIEISYDYNHSKNDYDIVLNLTELANLIKTLQGKAIDDFVKALRIEYSPVSDEMQNEYDNVCLRFEKIAEQLKAGGENEQR